MTWKTSDQFVYVVGEHTPKGTWDYFKKIGKKPSSLFSLDEIATEVKRINQELKDLSERIDRCTKPLDSGTEIPAEHKNKQTLIDSLCFEDQSLRIIAVWGIGGVGKSTLVNSVYKTEAFRFDCHVWVSISQSYKLENIWEYMLKVLGKDKLELAPEKMNSADLRVELIKILDKKRYLIILDDVWTADALFRLREVLVDNGLGSRVIVTTRMEEAASVAAKGYKIKVEPLCDHDAWLLFVERHFRKLKIISALQIYTSAVTT
ncbi:hypothetical protein BAE44_0025549 [Dichanthelium oligosanthes]|uniref:NB-ARC domain-containing protein n=1 Tax=Dichanthelium oligosanthes TaxID=888268 RepID=A0A1E5UKM8_9POAL|nr:hypothetical protein BAE44_0025549 [Dichanthelium oligosanthes]